MKYFKYVIVFYVEISHNNSNALVVLKTLVVMVTSYPGFIPGPSLDWSGLDILRIDIVLRYANNVMTI